MVRLSGESSARRIRRGSSGRSGAVPTGTPTRHNGPAGVSNGAAKDNTLPFPMTLSTQMRPPISSTESNAVKAA